MSIAALAAELLLGGRVGARRAARDTFFLCVVGAAWAWFANRTWGAITPSSILAKGTLGSAGIGFLASLVRTGVAVGVTAWPTLLGCVVLVFAARCCPAAPTRRAGGRGVTFTIILGAGTLALLYAARHVKVYTRYVAPLTALLVALAAASSVRAASRLRTPRLRRCWMAPVGVALLWNLAVAGLIVVPSTQAYARSMRTVLLPLALRLRDATRPADVIATPNIGLIGWVTERPILDLNGLASPDVVPYKRSGRLREYIEEHPPAVLVEMAPQPRAWQTGPGRLVLREIDSGVFDGMFVQGPDPMYITVYRVLGVQSQAAAP